jgi:hypothetical protein
LPSVVCSQWGRYQPSGEENRVIILEASRGGFEVSFDLEKIDKITSQKIEGCTSYETPVTLLRRINLE